MAISGTTTNYTGRKKDLHIFQGVNPKKPATVTPSFGKISNYCAGVQKLVQRYTISLLNELGSQTNYPDFGTNFMTRLNNRSLSLNRSDIFPIFNLASAKVIADFKEYQANTDGLPTDEQLNTVLLEEVSVSANSVNLRVRLYPVQSTPVEFVIPLPK